MMSKIKELDWKTIELLNNEVFNENELYKLEGVYTDDETNLIIKLCKSAKALNITCVSPAQKKPDKSICEQISAANQGNMVRYFLTPDSEDHLLFASSITMHGEKIDEDEFRQSLAEVHTGHLELRRRLFFSEEPLP